jgi:hypothetical protein
MENETVTFAILKPTEGGWRKADLRKALRKHGITKIKDAHTPYIGLRGIAIPAAQVTPEVEDLIFSQD